MKNCSDVTVMLKSVWRYYGLKMFQNHFLEGTEKEEPEIVKKEHGDSDEYVPFSYFISQFFFQFILYYLRRRNTYWLLKTQCHWPVTFNQEVINKFPRERIQTVVLV